MTQAAGQVDPESEVHLIVRGFRIDLSLISNISRQHYLERKSHSGADPVFDRDIYEGRFSRGTFYQRCVLECKLSDLFVIRDSGPTFKRFSPFIETFLVSH